MALIEKINHFSSNMEGSGALTLSKSNLINLIWYAGTC